MDEEQNKVSGSDGNEAESIIAEHSKNKKKRSKKRYLLLLCLAIVIFAGLAMYKSVCGCREASNRIILEADNRAFITMFSLYRAENDGTMPKSGEDMSGYLIEGLRNWTDEIIEKKDDGGYTVITWLGDDSFAKRSEQHKLFIFSDEKFMIVSKCLDKKKEQITIIWDGVDKIID